ncbi:MAG: 3'(2'),5'-bisphosphate nucleotidase CysQ, partial [Thiohalobacteraceae bacterium]
MNDNDNFDACALLDATKQIALDAGRRILEIYGTDFAVEHKDDKSPLTAADMASHKAIVAGLQRLTPEIPILSEESANIPFSERSGWQRYWLIDPLDGTREFIKRNGEFTVNIALIHAGRAELGIVHVPVSGMTYFACAGGGAFKQQAGQAAEAVHVRKLPKGPVMVAGSRSHSGDSLLRFLDKLGPHELVSMGSALKLCLVAEGAADIYPRLGLTSEWDTAAAQCVVEAAGGQV